MASDKMHIPAYMLDVEAAAISIGLSQLRRLSAHCASGHVNNTTPVNSAATRQSKAVSLHQTYKAETDDFVVDMTICMHMNSSMARSYSLKHTMLHMTCIALHMDPCAWASVQTRAETAAKPPITIDLRRQAMKLQSIKAVQKGDKTNRQRSTEVRCQAQH
jgi:hypothetical protein